VNIITNKFEIFWKARQRSDSLIDCMVMYFGKEMDVV
jgi:hypothetical protein